MDPTRPHDRVRTDARGVLPNLVVIGAMKCGTSALHRHLDRHPEIAMSEPKELNFFFGPDRLPDGDGETWARGNWHRGLGWYATHFPAAPVRGESSPGYTSPDHPEVAARLAGVLPQARLICLVRDPVERAVSQYWHHRREGTESRPLEEALLDPASQYVARGRYHERLAPFLRHCGRSAIRVVAQEDLLQDPGSTLAALSRFLRVDERFWQRPDALDDRSGATSPGRPGTSARHPPPSAQTRKQLADLLRDDAERLRRLARDDFPAWSV
jgi:hypothetical protein